MTSLKKAFERTDWLAVLPLGELDVYDVPLESILLQLRLQRLPDEAGRDVRVLHVAGKQKINSSKSLDIITSRISKMFF